MTKPIIAFDLDDVLADSTEFWRLEINRRTGLNLTVEDYRVPGEYMGYYPRVWQTHKIDHLISIPDIDEQVVKDQSGIPLYPQSFEVLTLLSEKFELVVVTARNTDQSPETHKWLHQNYPDVFSKVVLAGGPEGLAQKNKGQICKELGAEWLVDDSPAHCEDALAEGVVAILFGEYGWHQTIPEGVVICRDWAVIKEYFDGR